MLELLGAALGRSRDGVATRATLSLLLEGVATVPVFSMANGELWVGPASPDRSASEHADRVVKVMGAAGGALPGNVFVRLLHEFSGAAVDGGLAPGWRTSALLVALELMMERLSAALIRSIPQAVAFAAPLLENERASDDVVALVLAIVGSLLVEASSTMTPEDETILATLAEPIEALQKRTANAGLADTAGQLLQLLRTRAPAPEFAGDADMGSVLKSLAHPLVPMRAAGLAQLRDLIEAGSPAVLGDDAAVERCIELFRVQLSDSDSYVYLSAVRGLVVLSLVRPAVAFDALCSAFTTSSERPSDRPKIGEALIQAARRAGDMLPVHAPLILDALLGVLRNAGPASALDADVVDLQASALSILSTVLACLGHEAGPGLVAVGAAVARLVEAPPGTPIELRRAAAFFFAEVFAGLADRNVALTELVRPADAASWRGALERVEYAHQDATMRGHAGVALSFLPPA